MSSRAASDGGPGGVAEAGDLGVRDAVPSTTSHPGPGSVRLPRGIALEVIGHARAETPLEACGLIPGTAAAAAGGRPLRYVPCRNLAASRTRFEVHPEDYLGVVTALDATRGEIWGIVHSHPATPAVPSGLDVTMAAHPDALYLVVSLAGPEPDLRAWRIVRGVRHEVAVEIA